MDPASNFLGGAAEIYFHSRRSISVALSKYVSAVFGILISIHVVNTDVFNINKDLKTEKVYMKNQVFKTSMNKTLMVLQNSRK